MPDDAIEPSEILIDSKGTVRENSSKANPWIRFIARFFDYSLFFVLLTLLRKLSGGRVGFGGFEQLIPFEYLVWIPIEALFLSTWGKTPGKWFLKTKLIPEGRSKLDYMAALRRSFLVWFRGLGMFIPFINFLCMLVAYQRLKTFRKTSWDRDEHIRVTHGRMGQWRVIVATFFVVLSMLFYSFEKRVVLEKVMPNTFSQKIETVSWGVS